MYFCHVTVVLSIGEFPLNISGLLGCAEDLLSFRPENFNLEEVTRVHFSLSVSQVFANQAHLFVT